MIQLLCNGGNVSEGEVHLESIHYSVYLRPQTLDLRLLSSKTLRILDPRSIRIWGNFSGDLGSVSDRIPPSASHLHTPFHCCYSHFASFIDDLGSEVLHKSEVIFIVS